MPSTVVHVGFALLVAAGLLGFAYDRRSVLVVCGVVVFVDLDVFTSLVVEGAHRAMFHTLLIPLAVGGYLVYDTRIREESTLLRRYGEYWVRVAWVSIAAFVLSAVGLDLFTAGGVNPFYPLFDQFYSFTGHVTWSSTHGLTQTFVEVRGHTPSTGGTGSVSVDVGQKGSTQTYRVASGVNPNRGTDPASVERVFPVVYTGWQTTLTVTGVVVTAVKLRLGGSVDASDDPEPRDRSVSSSGAEPALESPQATGETIPQPTEETPDD